MIPIAIACFALVCAAAVHLAHQRRSLAERAVDALYRLAAITYATARAADGALCAYRMERQRANERHIPMYAEVGR
ncbi:MAG: hypothetical protein KatS3mg004_1876 [Bryobacteraceae bacterium]|nr:MAG: hypothetical protein KatS3mg004_1876 [Bryobacteraceae bacterium]